MALSVDRLRRQPGDDAYAVDKRGLDQSSTLMNKSVHVAWLPYLTLIFFNNPNIFYPWFESELPARSTGL